MRDVDPTPDRRLSDGERRRLEHQASIAEWVTISWNGLEMLITVGLGIAARSLALVAFGFDSLIEVFASLVVVWHLRHPNRRADHITARALRLVAVAFFALGLSLTVASVWAMVGGHRPDASPLGIAYLALTVVVMMALAVVKRHLGNRLGSRPLAAEARMSLLDGWVAVAVLTGLVLNAALGWWWADAAAAIVIAAAAVMEGTENWQEAREFDEAAG